MKKRLVIIMSIIILLFSFRPIAVNASTALSIDEMRNKNAWFEEQGKDAPLTIKEAVSESIGIGKILYSVAATVAIVTGLVLAVKIIKISSPAEKAKAKQSLIWYIIAVLCVFGAVGIYQVLTSVFHSVTG